MFDEIYRHTVVMKLTNAVITIPAFTCTSYVGIEYFSKVATCSTSGKGFS